MTVGPVRRATPPGLRERVARLAGTGRPSAGVDGEGP